MELNDNAATKSFFNIEIESNTEDIDFLIEKAGIKLEGSSFCYLLSFQTKEAAVPGKVPQAVEQFLDFMRETALISNITEEDHIANLIKAYHEGNRLYLAIDFSKTILAVHNGALLVELFKIYRQYSLDFKLSFATEMTIKSIIEKVAMSDLGQSVSRLRK